MEVSADAARRFLVARHFLSPARSLPRKRSSVLTVLRRLGSIQFDPIAVAGRNHDLMLHARIAGYEPSWCDDLYARREIFETTNRALSFIPAEEFPWYRVNAGRGFFKPEKRRWGYYVLPILFGDRLVGRIEPRIDREERRVEVLGLWWEDDFYPKKADGFVTAMREALDPYVRFAGCETLEWRPHLAADARVFG